CFDAFASRRPPEQLRRWVSEADTWVLLAFDGDRPIGYDCVTRRVPADLPFSLLVLSPDEVWVRDVYTVLEYRRLRVRRTLRAHRVRVMRALGYAGYVAAVSEKNVSALIATYDDTVATV